MVLRAETVKVEVVPPFAITSVGGNVRFALLLPTVITLDPTEGLFNVRVHAFEAPADKLAGLQVSDAGATTDIRLMVTAAELLPRDAVTVADWLLSTVAVVASNAALRDEATLTDAGTLRTVLEFDRVTVTPAAVAALVKVTVQWLVPLGPRLR
jgi:hypothetical protein